MSNWTLADDWKDWGELRRWGPVFEPALSWEENNVRHTFLLQCGETVYMYYVGGNEKGIALAKIPYEHMRAYATAAAFDV